MLLAVSLCSFTVRFAHGTTYNTNGSSADVQAKINLATNGDIIVIPAGTFTWTNGVSCNVDVTLQGAGTSATGGGDQTVIIDNYASGQPLMAFQGNSTGVFRMTGITVQSGSGSTKDGGTIEFSGPGNVGIDHCHLNATSTAIVIASLASSTPDWPDLFRFAFLTDFNLCPAVRTTE
jgi:hypothetical protein